MADAKEIIVVLKVEGGGGETPKDEPAVDVGSPDTNKGDSFSKSVYGVLGVQLLKSSIDSITNWAEYYWNRELMLNDDYIGQRNKQIALQCINQVTGFVSATASGALMGSAFGPIGAAVGAVIGAIGSAANTVHQNVQAMDQQNIMLNQMNAQLSYTRQRAGWSLEAASIGEDL